MDSSRKCIAQRNSNHRFLLECEQSCGSSKVRELFHDADDGVPRKWQLALLENVFTLKKELKEDKEFTWITFKISEWEPLLNSYLYRFQLRIWQLYFTFSTLICFFIRENETTRHLKHYHRLLQKRPPTIQRFLQLLFMLSIIVYLFWTVGVLVR